MRHKVAGRSLSRRTGHRMSLYHNLTSELLWHERIITTVAKAKEVRSMADKVISLGKEGSVHSRRQALLLVNDKRVVDKVFDELAKRFADRSGGYTRVLKMGRRKGDAAPMAIIELVK
ncbi:MAG: 50S ribosomal protein L17 [Dehalococcoidia bacterium]|nr:50S ribosomal protein L17 [Dehalococcoidia bacterium]